MDTQNLLAAAQSSLLNTSVRPEVVMQQGRGMYLFDTEGKQYLDFIGGWAVNCLGHCPAAIVEAVDTQSRTLITPSPAFYNEVGDEIDIDEQEFIKRFQKTSRVTLWVLPEEHQIVRITFDNVGLQFLPLRWLVQVDDISLIHSGGSFFEDHEGVERVVVLGDEVDHAREVRVGTGASQLLGRDPPPVESVELQRNDHGVRIGPNVGEPGPGPALQPTRAPSNASS